MIDFIVALFETTIGIGLILPGSTIILLLGAASARGYLDVGWGFEWVLAGFIFAQSLKLGQLWLSRAGLFFAFLLIFGALFTIFRRLIIKSGKQFMIICTALGQSIKAAATKNEYLLFWQKKFPRTLSFIKARTSSQRNSSNILKH